MSFCTSGPYARARTRVRAVVAITSDLSEISCLIRVEEAYSMGGAERGRMPSAQKPIDGPFTVFHVRIVTA